MAFRNRVRLPIMFTKPQFPMERSVFRLADGSTKVQSIVIRNTYEGKTDQLPESWHRALVIAMAHDTVTIENERLLSDVSLDGDYGIDWQDFLQYPIAQATFSIQVTPFNATNNNCQTCSAVDQMNLVDDTTDETWDEGTTHEFPDVLTDNDYICCYPAVITLVSFNALYLSAASISAGGLLTATVNDPAPPGENVLLATYRVTCPDGTYDEADVFGNIGGTGCAPPVNLEVIVDPTDRTIARGYWDAPTPAPGGGYDWELYLGGVVVQSGNKAGPGTLGSPLVLTGLTIGESYILSVVSNCGGGDLSVPATSGFNPSPAPGAACGQFLVTYIPYADSIPQSISYLDCDGGIQDLVLSFAQATNICMMITPGNTTPLYYVASSADITINYVDLC